MTILRTLAIPMIALSAPLIFSACSTTPPANVTPPRTTQVKTSVPTTPTTKTEPTGGMVMTNEDDHHIDITSESQFLTVMIPHHEEAVMTANIIVERSTNTKLKNLAKTIISDQTKEITMMKGWLKADYPTVQLTETKSSMMPDLKNLSGDALDRVFLSGMISHHKSAISEAKELLDITQKKELTTLANNIITSQTAQIKELEHLLEDIGQPEHSDK